MSDQDQHEGDNLANLRKAADEGKAARAELEQMKRQMAFVKAGVDIDTKLGQMLLKTYDGELDTEAIKAEATEVGAIKTAVATPEPEGPVVDGNETRERQDLASNAGSPSTLDEANPMDVAMKNFETSRGNGLTREDAAGSAYFEILKAAQAGDKRVLL